MTKIIKIHHEVWRQVTYNQSRFDLFRCCWWKWLTINDHRQSNESKGGRGLLLGQLKQFVYVMLEELRKRFTLYTLPPELRNSRKCMSLSLVTGWRQTAATIVKHENIQKIEKMQSYSKLGIFAIQLSVDRLNLMRLSQSWFVLCYVWYTVCHTSLRTLSHMYLHFCTCSRHSRRGLVQEYKRTVFAYTHGLFIT
jgi:hypothetical protein